jgi:hypothetical protein
MLDNVFASADNLGGGVNIFLDVANTATQLPGANYNLFWAPSATGTWTSNYTFGANDIHSAGSPPVFVNTTAGNYALAPSSPGYNGASDGTSMGIAWNSDLKQQWAANAFALTTRENTGLTGVITTSFTNVEQNRYYQVYFYVPNSPCAQSAEQFTIEGVGGSQLLRNISGLNTTTWLQPGGPSRYITLGRHRSTTDTTLTVSWQHTNCVERVFIRELPTADEAYQWIVNPGQPMPPQNLRVLQVQG